MFIFLLSFVLSEQNFFSEVSETVKSGLANIDQYSEKTQSQLRSLGRQKKLFYPEALLHNLRVRVGNKLPVRGLNPQLHDHMSVLKRRFVENDSLLYVEDAFDSDFFARIQKEAERVWKDSDIEGNCNLDGTDRSGGYVRISEHDNSLYNLLFANEEFLDFISGIGGRHFHPADFPIELREYGSHSAGMRCHKDLQLYKDDQGDLEIVITVKHEEQSKCEFIWYDKHGKEHRVRTQPNSLSIVKPNAAVHCVSDTAGGTREILKFVLVSDYSKPKSFKHYAKNDCDQSSSPNAAAIKRRSSLSGEL
jgi:hypothetical protein